MSRPFHFKQFSIYQEKAAMKVGTDGCLLGAWAAIPNEGNCLDIGTGTGIIALMCAQRERNLDVIALESDKDAAEQAIYNFSLSPWKNRISMVNQSLQDYKPETKFNFIISNPPFFLNGILPAQASRSIARHATSLHPSDIISFSIENLTPTGHLSIIYPPETAEICIGEAEKNGLYLARICKVIPRPGKQPNRMMMEFSLQRRTPMEEEIELPGQVTFGKNNKFNSLLSEFYLGL